MADEIIIFSSAAIRHSQALSLRRKNKKTMEKSLLDIVHPRPKYNFSAYRKESYQLLQFLLDRVREKAQHLCEQSVTSGEDALTVELISHSPQTVITLKFEQ